MTLLVPPSSNPKSPLPSLRVDQPLAGTKQQSFESGRRGTYRKANARAQRASRQEDDAARLQPTARRQISITADVLGEIGLLISAFAASIGVARLIQGGFGGTVIGPVFLTVFVGTVVSSLLARKRAPLLVVLVVGALASGLTALWWIAPGSTRFGIPTITTFHVLRHEIDAARAVMGSHRTPVPAVPGIVLIASTASGVVCVIARTLWEFSKRSSRHWTRLVALLPTFGMFCYSAPLSAEIDRPQTTVCYLIASLFFVAASDAGTDELVCSTKPSRLRAIGSTIAAPLGTGLTALLVFLVASAALGGTVPVPFPWWNTPDGPGGYTVPNGHGGTVTAESMVANLRADEVTRADSYMFQATTTVPTYWQVGLLTDFNGTEWLPDAAESAALDGHQSGGDELGPSVPDATGIFKATVTVQGFTGRLLPAPPNAIAQTTSSPGPQVEISDTLGVIAPDNASSGEQYQLVAEDSVDPTASSAPKNLSQIYAGLGSTAQQYLALPSGIPAQVTTIAHQIVRGAKTPLQEIQDLVNYLSGPAFAYTLDPPAVPAGQNPLISFLVTYRQGYCQQFAGAFGVLARELGIPVRLAVGFTAGHLVSAHSETYQVTGADAHVWPEVYMGADLGWVSFDPTPGPATGEPTPKGVIKGKPSSAKSNGSGTGDTVPKKFLKTKGKLPTNTTTSPSANGGTTHGASKSASAASGLAFAGVIVAVLVIVGLFMLRRYRRSARGGPLSSNLQTDPDHVIQRAWLRASTALGRAGFTRSQWVTPVAHAESVRTAVNDGARLGRGHSEDASASLGAATYGYMELAQLAELACYCPGRCTNRDARHAEQEAWRIERALRTSGMLRRLPTPPPPAPTMTLVKDRR